MGVAVDGSDQVWPGAANDAVLPTFSPYQSQPVQYVDVFNRGSTPFTYQISSDKSWVKATPASGTVTGQVRARVRVDWDHAPKGTTQVPLTVTSSTGTSVVVTAVVTNPVQKPAKGAFVEANGYVSIEADDYSRAVNGNGVNWTRIPDIGRTGDGIEPFPVTAATQTPGGDSPRLEYDIDVTSTGPVQIAAYLSPRLAALNHAGLRYAVSVDNEAPQIVDIISATGSNDTTMNRQWERNTSENVNVTVTTHQITTPGKHTVKFWMVDPTVVLQNLIVDTGGLKPSYLGPPESLRA